MRTGASGHRIEPPSDLLFRWRARRLSVDAETGQAATFDALADSADIPGGVYGRNGNQLTAGHAQPRFHQKPIEGSITRLSVTADTAGQDVERWSFPWPLKIFPLSIYVRLFPGYVPGASVTGSPWVTMIGNATTQGGYMGIRRLGTAWQGVRFRAAANLVSEFTEPAGAVFPMEVMLTLNTGGVLQLLTKDAATPSVSRNGAVVTDATMLTAGENWGTNLLIIGAEGRYAYEEIKIARAVQSFDSMALLS